jgi:pilus assembly protein Flp/PilA
MPLATLRASQLRDDLQWGWGMSLLRAFLTNESGATAIEYALIAAGIGVAIIASVNALGSAISGKFNTVKAALK